MSTGAPRSCDGLSVIDLGQGMAGSMPGLILADNGADVIKIEGPSGDWARDQPGFLMWNRNKRSVVLDLTDAKAHDQLLGLVRRADVLVDSFRPAVAERLGITWPELRSVNPRLVHCSISGFGPAAGFDDLAAYEGLVAAAMGRMVGLDHLNGAITGQDRDAPIFTAPPVASYGAGQLAVQGILAALQARTRTGRGDRVTTSLMQGIAAFLMRQELPRGSARRAALVSPTTHAGIELCFMTARCQDGRFLQMCARQDLHFRNWLQAIGLAEVLAEPRFARAPLGIERMEDLNELEEMIRERMSTRTQDDWMTVFTEQYDVGCDPFLTPPEFLAHPQLVQNGRVVEIDDPTVGACRQLGPLVNFSATPSRVERPAPGLGEHTDKVLAGLDLDVDGPGPAAVAGTEPGRAGRPLDGITVVELAYYIAGPAAGSLLAELGARVIKVETLDGDPYRRTGLQSAKFLHGKESIAVDLKSAAGVEILHQLVAKADIFVHSFRPGVPERLQIDYPTLSALNPALIYLYAASYGSKGPQSGRTAFHSTPNALAGSGIMQAGRGNPPVDDSFPDPGSALGAATAMLLGLSARERTGRGQQLETTMLASTGYIMSPWMVFYDGSPAAPIADAGQHGLSALYRLYRCREGWVFIACVQEQEWRAFARALQHPDWLDDPRFHTAAGRAAHDDELAVLIGAELLRQPARDWADRCREQGAPVVVASEVAQETWFEQQGLLSPASHPIFGDYWRPPPKIGFESGSARPAPAAAIGEHTRPLLAELGYSDDAISQLCAERVVGSWSVNS